MSNFKAIFVNGNGKETFISEHSNRDDAVMACVNFRGNYCLDAEKDRINGLKERNFYVLGCGPEKFVIQEV